jgi:hypothetical protein
LTSIRTIADFERLAGVRGTVLDLLDREQYRDFHGTEPPAYRRRRKTSGAPSEMNGRTSYSVRATCKGFSGLLPEEKSRSRKYQALNRLALRAVWLTLEAWADDPPELILFENVPRIKTRGRWLLDQIGELLRVYGAMSRKRRTTAANLANWRSHGNTSSW